VRAPHLLVVVFEEEGPELVEENLVDRLGEVGGDGGISSVVEKRQVKALPGTVKVWIKLRLPETCSNGPVRLGDYAILTRAIVDGHNPDIHPEERFQVVDKVMWLPSWEITGLSCLLK